MKLIKYCVLKKYIYILLFCLFTISSSAQKLSITDSLLHLIKISEDSNSVIYYKQLCWELRNSETSLAYGYGFRALQIAEKYNNEKEIASIYNYLGVIKRNQGDYSNALSFFFKALTISEEINNIEEVAYAYNNIGDINFRQNNDSMALIHFKKSYEFFKMLNNYRGKAYALNQMALLHKTKREYPKALEYNHRAIELRKTFNDKKGIASSYRNIGDIYALQKQFKLAQNYYQQSLLIAKQYDDYEGVGYTFAHVGLLYNNMNYPNKAIPYLDSALQIGNQLKSQRTTIIALRELAFAYASKNEFEKAYSFLLKLKFYSDNSNAQEVLKRTTQLTLQYEFEKQQQIKELETQLLFKKQKLIQIYLIVGIIVGLIIFLIFFRAFITNKKTTILLKEKNEEIENQKEELININNLLIKNDEIISNANATKDKFFSIIAHDLKAPFSSILGFASILYNEYDSFDEKSKKKYIKSISDVSENTYKLLQNLLDWALSQIGKLEFMPDDINIGLIINDNITLLNSISAQKRIKVSNTVNFQTYAYADMNMINTVVRNLLSNAIKFTNREGSVYISHEILKQEVIITISDTGIGMTKEELGGLFNIDYKFNKVGTDNEKGTGLGLILCKEFIEVNKGKIWAKSQIGQGSSFYFSLPLLGAKS